MIERVKYYVIVWRATINAFCRYPNSLWYIDTDCLKTDCTSYLMCTIAYDMLYEMGV